MTCEEALVRVFWDVNAGLLGLAARGAYWTLCVYEDQLMSVGALRLLLGKEWRVLVCEIERHGLGRLFDAGNGLYQFRRVMGLSERKRVKGRNRMRRKRQHKEQADE